MTSPRGWGAHSSSLLFIYDGHRGICLILRKFLSTLLELSVVGCSDLSPAAFVKKSFFDVPTIRYIIIISDVIDHWESLLL